MLNSPKRRWVITTLLTQPQRLELESFALKQRAAGQFAQACSDVGVVSERDKASSSYSSDSSDSEQDTNEVSCLEALEHQPALGEWPHSGEDSPQELLALCDEHTEDPDLTDSGLEHTEVSDAVEFSGECEQPIGSSCRVPRGRSSVRGLYARQNVRIGGSDGCSYYSAGVGVGMVQMTTRKVRELSLALDWLLVLIEVKQRAQDNGTDDFSSRLRGAFHDTLAEHNLSMEDLGLTFCLQVSKKFWVGSILTTPAVHTLDEILAAVRRLAPFRGRVGVTSLSVVNQTGLAALESDWSEFRTLFLDVCEAAGQCRQKVAACLAAKEEAHRPFRDAQLERWNRRRMLCDEQHQRRCIKEELKRERLNRKAMAREERRSWTIFRRDKCREDNALRRIHGLLGRWSCTSDKQHARQKRAEARNRASEAKQKTERARAAAQVAKRQERSAKLARQAQWQSMNCRDLTMADILERRWAAKDVEH